MPLSSGVGTMRYSLLTVTVPSGPFTEVVFSVPPTAPIHLMVAAGLLSAASHWATTTGSPLVLAWTTTGDAEFLGLAEREREERWGANA